VDLSSGQVIGQYRVESVLGQGGMAIVYRVRHEQLGSEHALKVLTVTSKSIRARLLQEGRVQATLRHENIVSVTDVVTIGDAPGLVMELVKGPTLEDLLSHKKLLLDQVDLLAQGILRGVAAAHRQDLIHRDLKPSNILLELGHGRIVPKVADFGLAKVLDAGGGMSQTRSGVAMGTPHYMAPEQIRDAKSVDARTDVFALGAIFYEMVSGERAFPGEDMLTIFLAISEGKARPIREHCPDLPEHMAAAIEGALQIDRDQRIASCDALLALWRDEDHTDPGFGDVDTWTDDLMAAASAASAASGGGDSAPGGATMEPPRSSGVWSAPSALELPTSPTIEAFSKTPTTGSLGAGTWTDELLPPLERDEEDRKGGALKIAIAGGATVLALLAVMSLRPGEITDEKPLVEEVELSAATATEELAEPAGATTEDVTTTVPSPASPSARDKTTGPVQITKKKPRRTAPTTAKPRTKPSTAPADPTPRTSPAPAPRTEPSTVTPELSSPPARQPQTARSAPKPSGPPPGTAWARVKGSVESVYLRSAQGTFQPGDDIPAGQYKVQVFFKPGQPTDIGNVTLAVGELLTLSCTKEFLSCNMSSR
jgi:serine/threonine-protein kinase